MIPEKNISVFGWLLILFVRPDFWTHAIDKLNSIRPFEQSLDIDNLNEYLPTVSLKEFSEKCDHIVDTIVWGR